MKTAGIIAEYNPFHGGHEYHIKQTRCKTGCDCVIVIMSGNFVQRGEPAIIDKYTRTRCALLGGADLVIELPVVYSLGSAQYFANGAVSILNGLGGIDFLSFGMESGTAAQLGQIAQVLIDEPEDYHLMYLEGIRDGMSAPAAREYALNKYLPHKLDTSSFSLPNNILALEYVRALTASHSPIKPIEIQRTGSSYHDEVPSGEYISATAARNMIIDNDILKLSDYIPQKPYELLSAALINCPALTLNSFSSLLDYAIRASGSGLSRYMDINDNLANKILAVSKSNAFLSFSDYIEAVKSRDLTYTRISRALFHILLGITWDEMNCYSDNGYSQYARILGFNDTGREYLSSIRKTSAIPVITKTASASEVLTPVGMSMFEKDIFAADIYRNIVNTRHGYSIDDEFRHGPIII